MVQASPQSFWTEKYFAPLDGLRALSVLLVIAFHVKTTASLQRFVEGHLGVDIFFVLSGLLITTLLLREETARGSISLAAFYTRRAFRILPPYFFGIIVYLAIGALLPSQHAILGRTLAGLPYFLTLRNEFVPAVLNVAYGHTWSLSIEEKFYILWPVIFFWSLRKFAYRWMLLLSVVILPFFHWTQIFAAYVTLLIGAGLAVALELCRGHRLTLQRVAGRIPAWMVISVWLGSYLLAVFHYNSLKLMFSASTACLVGFMLVNPTWLNGFFGCGPLVWVGKRTYSMYLLHALFLNFVENKLVHPSSNLKYIVVVLTTYLFAAAASELCRRTFEQRLQSFGRRISERMMLSQDNQARLNAVLD